VPLRLKSWIALLLVAAVVVIAALVAVRFLGTGLDVDGLDVITPATDHHAFPMPGSQAVGRTEQAALPVPPATDQAPHNVILLLGDGVGLGHLATGSALIFGPRGGLAVESAPITGLVRTSASNNLVTDSAAAGSAMATGLKTHTGTISHQPADGEPVTLFERAKARGMAVGFVTTSGLADATPATFLAHSESRYDFASILAQILRSDADVLIGGTFERHLKAMSQPDYLALLDRAESVVGDGRRVVRSGAELATAGAPVVALFPPRPGSRYIHGPPLVESVDRALDLLAGNPSGFLLVVESEETDEGAHAKDLERVLDGLRELDAAVVRALAFASDRSDTLVLVTADHDTAGIAITDGGFDDGIADVRWTDEGHLGTWVPLFAFGPGAGRFSGVLDNTDIGRRIADLLGVEGFSPAP